MSSIAVVVRGLSKQYRLGGSRSQKTLRESVSTWLTAPFRAGERRPLRTLWALRDVSLEINEGEVIGIVGRNGSGKSTLLKVLSRIVEPTEGFAEVHGRVGSLLEVGTGFHPDLTGRENIFLNGAILGMKRSEIRDHFDEIVAFAEVEEFIDTPVKHYSSGMYMRLAFAVAAFLQPEVLIVDEVLAVGDAAFQRKCLGKMSEAARGGRTVIFVSHNLPAVQRLCTRCVLLEHGQVRKVGTPAEVIEAYVSDSTVGGPDGAGEYDLSSRANPIGDQELIIRRLRLSDAAGKPRDSFLMGQPILLEVEVAGLARHADTWLGVTFKSLDGQWMASINTGMTCRQTDMPRSVQETATLRIPRLPFNPGRYVVTISVARGLFGRIDYVERAGEFSVENADVYGTGYLMDAGYGVVYLEGEWEIVGRPPSSDEAPKAGAR